VDRSKAVDVLIRVRPSATTSTCPVEAQVDGSGAWLGESTIDAALNDPAILPPQEYGVTLARQLFNPAVERALHYAGVFRGEASRIRLFLEDSPQTPHAIRWERLYIDVPQGGDPWPVATSPSVSFSRYIPVEMRLAASSDDQAFRLLIAVSSAEGIRPSDEIAALMEEFARSESPSRLQVVKLEGTASLRNIGDTLSRLRCHGLHLVAHGDFKALRSQGRILLQAEDGSPEWVAVEQLRSLVNPHLRLVVLQSCKSAPMTSANQLPYAGAAAALVRAGVPAVVAMQDVITSGEARVFSSAFYRELLQDGLVDRAANAGRRALSALPDADWSIPALFHRLEDGRLWSPDPVREAVQAQRSQLAGTLLRSAALPIHVTEGSPSEAPAFASQARIRSLLQAEGAFVCLTGPPGFNQLDQLERLFLAMADDFLRDGGSASAPVWLRPGDLDPERQTPLVKRCTFLVDLSDTPAVQIALRRLRRLVDRHEARCVVVLEEESIPALAADFPGARILYVRPMDLGAVRDFLLSTGGAADRALCRLIDRNGLGEGLATAPWLLQMMRKFARGGHVIRTRAEVLALVAEEFLGSFSRNGGVPRTCVEAAARGAAWELQIARTRQLAAGDLWRVLREARGVQDFPLSSFQSALVQTRVLVPGDTDGVRFGYRALQSYFAACHLLRLPRRDAALDDVVSSLGRVSRLRHWEETLCVYAGLLRSMEDRYRLLRNVLAGSSLLEGEQLYLAARLFVEMQDGESGPLASTPAVQQILDALVWRSRPDYTRPYPDRCRAVEALASLRHPDAIPALITLAFGQSRHEAEAGGPHPGPRYDYTGIRRRAAEGLFVQEEAVRRYASNRRTGRRIIPVLDAWQRWMLDRDESPLLDILRSNDDVVSPLAAFAFGMAARSVPPGHALLEMFRDAASRKKQVYWAIAEVLGRMDTGFLIDAVILPWLSREPEPEPDGILCYLIQLSCVAPAGSAQRDYLTRSLSRSSVAHRAIRAIAKVREDATLAARLRELCYRILRGDWDGAATNPGLSLRSEPRSDRALWKMHHAAIEALRDAGDLETVNTLRALRTRLDPALAQLSFQVAEEIYWRCTGGLADRPGE
jgi:hypothetical protein